MEPPTYVLLEKNFEAHSEHQLSQQIYIISINRDFESIHQ